MEPTKRAAARCKGRRGAAMASALCVLALLAALSAVLLKLAVPPSGGQGAAIRRRVAANSLARALDACLAEESGTEELQTELRRRLTAGDWPWVDEGASHSPDGPETLTLAVDGADLPAGDALTVELYWTVEAAAFEAADPAARFAEQPPALHLTVRCGGAAVCRSYRLRIDPSTAAWTWQRE